MAKNRKKSSFYEEKNFVGLTPRVNFIIQFLFPVASFVSLVCNWTVYIANIST